MKFSPALLWLLILGLLMSFSTPETACEATLSKEAFEQLLTEIEAKRYSKKKVSTAKSSIAGYCLSVAQAKAIVEQLPFESARLDFASYALEHLIDLEEIEVLYEPFLFSSSIEQLKARLNELDDSSFR
ncbi:MAG: DUF4476 domain-containing protein [Bacteroidota bacterium]